MTGPEAMPGFNDAERALLDGYIVPLPTSDVIDRVVQAAMAETPALPPLRKAVAPERRPRRWRRAWRVAGAACALGIVTAAAAERGAFGPVVQDRVQTVVARAMGNAAPATHPPVPEPKVVSSSAAAPSPAGSTAAADIPDARIAPVVERLRRDPQIGTRVDRMLERRKARQLARGETPTPPDMLELARRYRQLSPAKKAELRLMLATLPPEDQAEIRALIRDYRKARRTQD